MYISRRQCIAGGAALATALATRPLMAQGASPKPGPIGLELWSVRTLFAADPTGTLEKVAAIGFREVEYAGGGYDKMDPAALRKTMDRLGLVAPSIQTTYEYLRGDFDGTVKRAKTLGADTIIVSWVDPSRHTVDAWKEVVADFNRLAERLKQTGLDFAFHNHDMDFLVKPGGISLFDRLLADSDPALVKIELDIGWAVAAGEDPKAIITRLPGRIYAYHVKDRTADNKVTAVGNGVIDYADIFTLNQLAGVKHFYVEIDDPPGPYFADIETSFTALRRLGI